MARTLTLARTRAQMEALITNSLLNTQTYYKITDRGDNGLLFRAAAVNRLESTGLRYMLCPATYATGADAYENDWIGQWTTTKGATATEGQLCIWNAHVWVAGATLSGEAPDVTIEGETPIPSGWTLIPKSSFTNQEYVEMIFNVIYDFENDWINRQFDVDNNEVGVTLIEAEDWEYDFNPVDYFDWNIKSKEGFYCYNNKIPAAVNNNIESGLIGNTFIEGIFNSEIGSLINNHVNKITNSSGWEFIGDCHNFNIVIENAVAIAPSLSIRYLVTNSSVGGTFDASVTEELVPITGTAE